VALWLNGNALGLISVVTGTEVGVLLVLDG